MQPTPPEEAANAEFAKDLVDTPERDPQEERMDARGGDETVEIDEPRKRDWRFWRRRQS